MEPTRAKFKMWGQHGIPELAGVNLGRESNSGLNIYTLSGKKTGHKTNRVKLLVGGNFSHLHIK